MTTVFSIGYQGKSTDEVCRRLVAAGVKALVDVRQRAWSYRPEYRKTALRNRLAESGIEYLHCRIAGNPFRPTKERPLSVQECTRLYSDYLRKTPEALAAVQELVESEPIALFCYEDDYLECHRGVLVEELIQRDPLLTHRPL